MATIIVNGEKQEVNLPLSLTELIIRNQVEQPDMVSVQVNGDFIVRDKYDDTAISDGDEVDFLYFMGGGCC
ncbi:thiamine biosynthesis protein ThiS [Bacteroidia bacterium]|nr:thiamine biosynthesis protein ThiS [Bacteroidia bacterium]GHU58970.1 thiamine biosynthesis protein ThiS [Bacteroidia bacterium]